MTQRIVLKNKMDPKQDFIHISDKYYICPKEHYLSGIEISFKDFAKNIKLQEELKLGCMSIYGEDRTKKVASFFSQFGKNGSEKQEYLLKPEAVIKIYTKDEDLKRRLNTLLEK